jgi:cytoskeletal protein RodZ
MKEIGQTLKDKREQMNLSLSDVHNATRVQEKYLAAIEVGNLDVFKAEVYYKSFLRSYSKYLGFDPEEFIDLFNAQKYAIEQASKLEQTSFSESLVNQHKNSFYKKRILIVSFVIICLALLAAFVYLYINISKIAQPMETDSFKQVENEESVSTEDNTVISEQEESLIEENVAKTEIPTKQNLKIEAKENVWIRVDIDGRTVYEGTLLKDSIKIWEADKSFMLKLGYAPGVKVFFNGEDVDVMSGAIQDINTVVLKKKNDIRV